MKYVKMIGVLALAATALMAFAASASASSLTSPAGTTYSGKLTAVHHGAHVTLTGPVGLQVQCKSHVEGEVTSQTPSSQTVVGKVTNLSFYECTKGEEVHVSALGTLEAHTEVTGTDNGNGTITASGFTVEITKTIIGTCSYQTGNNLDIGKITGSKNTGETATFDISAKIPRHSGSAFCGSEGIWEGGYTVETPMYLDVK